ncbi:hypothetical protein AB1I88_22095, partial [Bacillus paranthracis]|uniref:hypothetical protein n=1 Tax=Bacillus paranthracis TaxID=2026186 RepID=UPI0035560D6A
KFETRQGLFDVPTFITSIKDNKKLRGKTAFYIKIYVKLMDVGRDPKQYDFISKTQRSYYTLFIYPTLSSASITIFYY